MKRFPTTSPSIGIRILLPLLTLLCVNVEHCHAKGGGGGGSAGGATSSGGGFAGVAGSGSGGASCTGIKFGWPFFTALGSFVGLFLLGCCLCTIYDRRRLKDIYQHRMEEFEQACAQAKQEILDDAADAADAAKVQVPIHQRMSQKQDAETGETSSWILGKMREMAEAYLSPSEEVTDQDDDSANKNDNADTSLLQLLSKGSSSSWNYEASYTDSTYPHRKVPHLCTSQGTIRVSESKDGSTMAVSGSGNDTDGVFSIPQGMVSLATGKAYWVEESDDLDYTQSLVRGQFQVSQNDSISCPAAELRDEENQSAENDSNNKLTFKGDWSANNSANGRFASFILVRVLAGSTTISTENKSAALEDEPTTALMSSDNDAR